MSFLPLKLTKIIMNLDQRIDAFVTLGRFLAQFASPIEDSTNSLPSEAHSVDLSLPDAGVFF